MYRNGPRLHPDDAVGIDVVELLGALDGAFCDRAEGSVDGEHRIRVRREVAPAVVQSALKLTDHRALRAPLQGRRAVPLTVKSRPGQGTDDAVVVEVAITLEL